MPVEIIAYLRYCPPEKLFFDVPTLDGGRFDLADREAPDGWSRRTDSEWVNILPPQPLPMQGWKVHVTATPEVAESTLQTCWDYCTSHDLGFKFLKSNEVVFLRSSKYGDRSASGKFVTIYPRTDEELEVVLHDLDPLLEGSSGPAILSDVRWRKGPLYVRYGAFHLRPMRTETGVFTWAVEDPDGRLVPDERRPGFHPPPWVTLPEVVEQAVAQRAEGRLSGFPYRPVRALHFSNGGGVYIATDADGTEVLLKEARPLAGLDGAGDDAVARLERERWAYETLAEMPEIPELLDYRIGHEHYFLVRELVDGEPLVNVARERNPLLRAGAEASAYAEYAAWVLDVLETVSAGLTAMHERGIVFGDLHPSNILVRPDGSLAFIDLEGAFPIDADRAQSLGAPGYIAPPTFRGAAIDHYAMSVMTLDLFAPMVRMINWHGQKILDLITQVRSSFPVPEDFEERVLRGLSLDVARVVPGADGSVPLAALDDLTDSPWPGAAPAESADGDTSWSGVADQLVQGILAAASPEREDRLYPGDPRQLVDPAGGVTFAHGAAGVLWTLHACGAAIPDAHRAWFDDAVERHDWDRPGLGDGLSGVALTLSALGHRDRAGHAVRRAAAMVDRWTGRSLVDGLAGVALSALRVGEDDGDAEALGLADDLTDRLSTALATPADSPAAPGIAHGDSGAALVFLRQFERTGDTTMLDHAEAALRRDLATLAWDDDTGVPQGDMWLRAPFLGHGSGGVALVAHRLLRHRTEPDLVMFRDRVRQAVRLRFVDEVGLLWGHAGLMLLIKELDDDGDSDDTRDAMVAHARSMGLHTVGFRGLPMTTGRFNLRLSTDFATGAAGALLAVSAIDGGVRLPW
ncbi:class III lanthionine synthetase LanKC [Nocardioides lijunqiniae]|uniref:class III lanthionine synthetase LanKC n=1 Tax=Nocardioides lijunqiniae TaxID=2760832 RepID=UPI001877E795|nr:class III lanthionine synthetase LanKC [Nocardioides lijunqiniae]